MDLVLKNLQPDQVQVFKKMAKLLDIRTKVRKPVLTEQEEDYALFLAMEEGKKSRSLSEKEAESFLNSLGK